MSKIDIFFATKDTGNIPVELQIRNMVGGFPGQIIVPFSDVYLNPEDVTTSTDGSIATSFVFPSPVYLQDGQEYSFVLLSNSNLYKVYCSRLGGTDILTGGLISSQPYAGTLFKSQNASTWTPDQDEDIKFEIHRCVFNTSDSAEVILKNPVLPVVFLGVDPLTTVSSSHTVVVNVPNHGLQTGDKATLAGVSSAVNGIPAVDINVQATVTVIDIDNFSFIAAGSAASSSGIGGGGHVTVTNNVVVDLVNINVQHLSFSGTSLTWGIKTTPVDGSLAGSYSGVTLSSNLQFQNPQVIYSEDNDPGDGSFFLQATMSTTNDAVSPVIDLTRSSMIAVSNRINETTLDTNGDAAGEANTLGGDALAKYVTKAVSLTTSATRITVYADIIRPQPSDVQIFVKYLPAQSSLTFDECSYVRVPATSYPTFDGSTPDEYVFELTDLVPFNNFAIKIVMLSTDESLPPLVQNFRAIATA